jgi:hypothetical protein
MGLARVAGILGGGLRWAGGWAVAGRGVGGGGAVEGEAVGAVEEREAKRDVELARAVLLGLLSVPSVLSVAH